ncbi:hypothetical protein PanWU01x14_028060 [Parasponia andersonii]|uniref:Uncharacterized protein n=1 Tax=Parasponia andersonii TaxID=3476 RepID=A0A2P5DV83_PARAD|nr:hypothetical protein PanWU01x14_028060 [Parasponia andersonii]
MEHIVQMEKELKLQLIWLRTSIEIMSLMIWEIKKSLSTKYQVLILHHHLAEKGKNPSNNISEGLGKLAESFNKMMEKSNEQVEKIVEVIVESARKKEHDQHNFMWEELTRLEIPVEVCIDVLDIIVGKP